MMNPKPTTNPVSLQAVTLARLISESEAMDFSKADAAPADELNQIIWKSVRGLDSKMPTPRESLVSPVSGEKKIPRSDDDDD